MTNNYIALDSATAYAPLPKHLREYQTGNLDDAFEYGYDFALQQIEAIPIADVVPVVHGEWIDMQPPDADGNVQCWCSVCGAGELHAENLVVPYCWKCGAKMRPTSMSGTNGGANNAAD